MKLKILIPIFILLVFAIPACATNFIQSGTVTYHTNPNLTLTNTYTTNNISSINVAVTPIYNKTSPADIAGLTDYWKFDEKGGTVFVNSINASNTAVITNSTSSRVTGKYDGAVNMGAGTAAKIAYNDTLLGDNACTIVMWVNKTGASPSSTANVIACDYGSTTNYMIEETPVNTVKFLFSDGTNTGGVSKSGWTNNSWHMITCVYNHTTQEYSLYIDLDKSGDTTSGSPNSVTHIGNTQSDCCLFGLYKVPAWQAFNGSIDRTLFYNRSLSATEIANLYYDGLQEMTVKTNSNATSSGNINYTSSVSVPFSTADAAITSLNFSVPSAVTQNGIVISDYQNTTTPFSVTSTVDSAEQYCPIASFTPVVNEINRGGSVAFTDTSQNYPTSWSWSFGDGSISTSQSPTHVYASAGIYNVTLIATNNGGSSTSFIQGCVVVDSLAGDNGYVNNTKHIDRRAHV